MKIILKSLTGRVCEKDVTPTMTVKDVKKLVEDEYAPEDLKLCYKGDLLRDSDTLEGVNARESDVFILAGRKRILEETVPQPPSNTTKSVQQQSSAATTATPSQQHQPKGDRTELPVSAAEETAPQPTAPTPIQAQGPPQVTPPSVQQSGPLTNSLAAQMDPTLIDSVVAMGFTDRESVAAALRAAYMNVDRAVEYLCTGIPEGVDAEIPLANPTAGLPSSGQMAPPPPRQQSQEASPLMQALQDIPQFETVRAMVRENPQALPVVLQQLGAHYPEMMQLIEENQGEFLEIMLGGILDEAFRTTAEPSAVNPPVSEREREAVVRLVEIGGGTWSQADALMAYRACDGSEEAAAQFLFENFMDNTQ